MPQGRNHNLRRTDYWVTSCVAELFPADLPQKESRICKIESTPAIAGRCHSWLNTIALAQGSVNISREERFTLKGFPFSFFCFVFLLARLSINSYVERLKIVRKVLSLHSRKRRLDAAATINKLIDHANDTSNGYKPPNRRKARRNNNKEATSPITKSPATSQ